MYLPYCIGILKKAKSNYTVGEDIIFDVLLKDAYNNTVSKDNGRMGQAELTYVFTYVATNHTVSPQNLTDLSQRGSGHETVSFSFITIGSYVLRVKGYQQATSIYVASTGDQLNLKQISSSQAQIRGSPSTIKVIPGTSIILLTYIYFFLHVHLFKKHMGYCAFCCLMKSLHSGWCMTLYNQRNNNMVDK